MAERIAHTEQITYSAVPTDFTLTLYQFVKSYAGKATTVEEVEALATVARITFEALKFYCPHAIYIRPGTQEGD